MTPEFWRYLLVSNKRHKFVRMWVEVASRMDSLPAHFLYNDLCQKHGYSRTSLFRHMEDVKQFWNNSGTNLGQHWDRGGFGFQLVDKDAETIVEQTWNKTETKKEPKKAVLSNDLNEKLREDIIKYLNQKTGKRFRPTNKKVKSLIDQRLKDGYTFEDFCQVIDNKCEVWLETEKSIYLRPMTLFGNKFDSYLNEKPDNPSLFMHTKIANHVTKAERYNNAISEAGEIDFTQFVEVEQRNQDNS
jgi:uncharacterized phage protein (TIGR02220 family)